MDLSLAGFLLSLATFLLGTITPFIYRTFFHVGLSIKPLSNTSISSSFEGDASLDFGVLLRVANAGRGSVLIDDIRVRDIKLENHVYRLGSSILADVTETKYVHSPLWSADTVEVLPLILKQDTVKVYVLELHFLYEPKDSNGVMEEFSRVLETPFKVAIRVNGTYRRYKIDFKRFQPAIGYTWQRGDKPPDE